MMAKNYTISERDYRRIDEVLRRYDREKNLRNRYRRRPPGGTTDSGGVGNQVIFEVVSASTGIGIYNCSYQLIDADEWDVADQFDIIDADLKKTETEKVLNLGEQIPVTDAWALETTYAVDDTVRHNGKDYICITGHCAGGCTPWAAGTWTIGQRCRHNNNAYILENSDKDSGDTDPPGTDPDWVLDNDEPGVGNNWQGYWEIPESDLNVGDLLLAWRIADDSGVIRWVGIAIKFISTRGIEGALGDIIDICET